FDLLREAVARAGAHKIIFGSDGPWLHPGVELYKVRALGLRREDERMVLGGTIMKLLRRRPALSAARVRAAFVIRGR
ncbi:MAG: amidohydrolase, partial [Acidobacteria bacterium]|nr:amidohydrolase [Acidobacteriota bacterium]